MNNESAREMYERGVPLRVLRKRFHMSESELQDMAPEEFETHPEPENDIGGY